MTFFQDRESGTKPLFATVSGKVPHLSGFTIVGDDEHIPISYQGTPSASQLIKNLQELVLPSTTSALEAFVFDSCLHV